MRNALTVSAMHAYKQPLIGATSFQMLDCRGSVGVRAITMAGGQSKSALTAEVSRPVATYTPTRNPTRADNSANQIVVAFMTPKNKMRLLPM